MIPVTIQTLIMTAPPSPSIIVLQPEEEATQQRTRRVVPIWIGTAEATQMGIALEKARFSRPMTHDLFLDALTNLDARIDHVLINEVKGNTFFARLTLRQHGRLIELDARPSDALSLAIRQEAPSSSTRRCWKRRPSPMFSARTRRMRRRSPSSTSFWRISLPKISKRSAESTLSLQ